jgi:acyl carrier protein
MNDTDITKQLTDIIREVFENPDLVITPESNAKSVPGWDSMKQVMIVMAVEDHFAIQLTTREIDRLRNVGDIIAAISAHQAS